MYKWCLGMGMLLLLIACGNKEQQKFIPVADTIVAVQADTMELLTDSMQLAEIMKEKPRVQVGNELFEDFIFNYAADEELQLKRTKFPLSYYEPDTVLRIEKEMWKHDHLFTQEHHYTLLFDTEEDMEMVGDTALNSVQVEWFYLATKMVKRYYFQRTAGKWILEAINLRKMQSEEENEDFIDFYSKFSEDSLYQEKHIADPLQFITIDPEDEFAILETTLDASQWPAYRYLLPTERLSNISYGQRNRDDAKTKILKVNGIDNGYHNLFYFRKKGDGWELYRYEDTST